jgi:hypothetical protein
MSVNTQMGMGHDRFDPALGAWASDSGFSESNHRHFYGRWAQLMKAESWAAVPRSNGWAGAGHAGHE